MHLALHRNTIGRWRSAYRECGLEQLLQIKPPGAKPGQTARSPPILAALQEQLDHDGFDGYLEVQHWLAEEYALALAYLTVHKLVRYRLKAKLKRARPRHAKTTKPRHDASRKVSATSSMQP